MTQKRVVVVLPTYNERENIQNTIEGIITSCKSLSVWDVHILVVDDTSPDGTAKVVEKIMQRNKNVHLISGKKEGLGKAYQRGFTYAITTLRPAVLVEMDADGQHDPKYLPTYLDAITKGADMVLGSRYMKGGSIPQTWGWDRKFFSIYGNIVLMLGFMNFSIKDWTTGYRVIKVWIVKELLGGMDTYNGYVFQIAFLDKALKLNAKVVERPLQFSDRTKGESKIQSGQYSFNILSYIFNNSSFIKFAIVGLIGFVVDFAIAAMLIATTSLSKPVANMISAEVAIVSNFLMNNFWSFKHKRITSGILGWIGKFATFNFISLGSIVIQGVGLWLALSLFGDTYFFGIPSWIIYKVLIIGLIIIPYSYVLYNKIIWKKK